MDTYASWSIVFQAVTATAIILAAWQVTYHARQMHRDLEMEYVKQYWDIVKSSSNKWRASHFLEEPDSEADARAIVDYLQLCEDELELRRNARVTDSTWALWAAAIASVMNMPHFRQALSGTPDEMYVELRTMLTSQQPKTYDPLKRSLIWRRLHGL